MSDDNKREALLRNVEKIKKKSPHVDPHEKFRTFHDSVTGKTPLEFQLWTKFKFPITIALFIDEFAVRSNSMNAKGSAVYAIIQEFPDDIKFLDENIILLASFHSLHQAHNSIFAPLVTYLQHLFHNEPHFSYFDGKKVTSLPIKPIVCIILIDKASAGWVLGIKCFSGRNSCFTCTIEGEYDKTHKHTYFPRNGDDTLSYRRTVKLHNIALNLNSLKAELGHPRNSSFHVIGAISDNVFFSFPTFDFFFIVANDVFHNVPLGIGKMLFRKFLSNEEEANKIINWSLFIPLTQEIFAHSNSLREKKNIMTGADWNNFVCYTSPALFTNAGIDQEKLTHWEVLSRTYGKLNSKREFHSYAELEQMQRSILDWNKKNVNIFGNNSQTRKMHAFSEHVIPECWRMGPFFCHSTACGGSALYKLKHAAFRSRRNMMPAIHNLVLSNYRRRMLVLVLKYFQKK